MLEVFYTNNVLICVVWIQIGFDVTVVALHLRPDLLQEVVIADTRDIRAHQSSQNSMPKNKL